MCVFCDQPGLTIDAYLDQVRDIVRRKRFAVQSVSGSANSPEFSYTVGLTAHGLPELIVVGVRHAEAARLLDVWATYLLDTSLMLPGETLGCGPFVMEAIEVERPGGNLRAAVALYGDAVRALQLAWADSRGVWPWEPGHPARRAGQPMLGERAPQYCDEHRPDRLDVPPHL